MSLIEGPFEGLEIQMTSSSSSTMIIRSPISTSAKNFVYVSTRVQSQMGSNICAAVSRGPSGSSSVYLHPGPSKTNSSSSSISRMVKWVGSAKGPQRKQVEVSLACQNLNMRLLVPKQGMLPRIKCNVGPVSWPQGCASAGLIFGLLVCSSSSAAHAEAPREKEDDSDVSHVKFAHGKKVYTDYSVIGIPGDGRCLFRSVAHGACLRSGEAAPSYRCQRELADDLRAQVADEFIKRRTETEWFVEGDFDTYVSEMRKPHVWGGEPELFMASHVLQMPITVYMFDEDAGGLISIAEYGQEYGNENPIRVLYHGFGHYDALQIPGKKVGASRL